MSKSAEAGGVVLGFTALALVLTYPLALQLFTHLPGDLGDPLLTTWTLAWDGERLRGGVAGLRGLWDAPNFFPYHHTLLYSDHLLGIAVFTAWLQWLSKNPVFLYNVAFIASVVVAGTGMYQLARELTGRRDAALVAGVIFACQPFRVSHLAHLQWLMTGWLPLGLWALHRYAMNRAWQSLIVATLLFLLQSLTTVYFTYFALLPIIVVGAAEMWRTRPPIRPLVLHALTALVLAAAVTLPIVQGYKEVRGRDELRRSTDEIARQSAAVGDYLTGPRTYPLRWLRGAGDEHELLPGLIALLLAGVGLVTARGSGRSAFVVSTYAALTVTAFALSLGPHGPYGWLLRVVPGLDGIRAPARLAVVVQIGVAVLASFGAARVLERMRPIAGAGTLVVIMLTVVAEGYAAPIPTAAFDARGVASDREAYAYLRAQPAGAVVELPTSAEHFDAEFLYQYMTLIHRHPVVNGHSGYVSPLLLFLGGGHSPLHDHLGDALAMFRAIGVQYLVLHEKAFEDAAEVGAWIDAIVNEPDQVKDVRRINGITIATLAPRAPAPDVPPLERVPDASMRVSASHSADRIPAMFDGDPDSRWLSGGPQSGDEWIAIAFDRPRDARTVRMVLASRSFGDYPRDLAIEAIDGGATTTLFRGPSLPLLAAGLVAHAEFPSIDVLLPPNHAQALRLRQLGSARTFFWSIHELSIWEARRP